jgi:hypothetical protein
MYVHKQTSYVEELTEQPNYIRHYTTTASPDPTSQN